MEELTDDDEILYYIASLNTALATQGISSTPETLRKAAIISQRKSIKNFLYNFFMEVQ